MYLLVLVALGCSWNRPYGSNHYAAGYDNFQLSEGVYYVWVQGVGGFGWDSIPGMTKTWHSYAATLCDGASEHIDVRSPYYPDSLLYRALVLKGKRPNLPMSTPSLVDGYLYCKSRALSKEELDELLSDFENNAI